MVSRALLDIVKKNGWNFSDDFILSMSECEQTFFVLELGAYKTIDYYKNRLSVIGFKNMEAVLDAGSGIGQWSIALSKMNKKVFGIDFNASRINCACHIAKQMNINNVEFQVGSLDNLPYESAKFDAVFCYGVLMFTHIEKTLSEFNRVLKPGGKIYLNFNSFGWYAHLIIDRGIKKRNISIMMQAIRMVLRALFGFESQKLIYAYGLKKFLHHLGFDNLQFAPEGCLVPCLEPNQIKPKSTYQPHYYGMRAVVELLGNKRA